MLSKVLQKTTCADCKFCCSFRRCSLWETPLFSEKFVENHKTEKDVFNIEETASYKYGRMNLSDRYETKDDSEEVACFYLDADKGCVLSEDEKPFDCKIWPLRIMKKDGELVIALTPTCPSINKVGVEKMQQLVKEGLGDVIYKEAKKQPYIIKKYVEGFPILARYNADI